MNKLTKQTRQDIPDWIDRSIRFLLFICWPGFWIYNKFHQDEELVENESDDSFWIEVHDAGNVYIYTDVDEFIKAIAEQKF